MLRLLTLLVCACSCGGCFLIQYPVISVVEDVRGRSHNGRIEVAGVVTDASGKRLEGTTTVYVRTVRVTGIESLESGAAKVKREERTEGVGASFDFEFPDVYQVDLLFRHPGFSDVRRRYRLTGDLWLLGAPRDDWFDQIVTGSSPLVARPEVVPMTGQPPGRAGPGSVYVWPKD
jgi:hypothetical protein